MMVFIRTSFSRVVYDTIRAQYVNNPLGALALQDSGSTRILIDSTHVKLYAHLRLGSTKNLLDTNANVIIDPDDSGGITTLADVANAPTFNSESVITPPMYGVAKIEWQPCIFVGEMGNFGVTWVAAQYAITNVGADDQVLLFIVPLPTNAYGKKLYLKNVRVTLTAADAGDFITRVDVVGILYGANASLNDDQTDITAAEKKEYTFTAVALDAYAMAVVKVSCTNANASDLDIEAVEIEAYYDT